jgi:hypothetical protein
VSFSKQTLLQAYNGPLIEHNNESKIRQSTRPIVLGKAKVMSYEDLQNTQAKRAEREKAIVDKLKVKRSRKRKSAAPEEPPASKVARTSEVLERAEGSWKALVAHTY